MYILSRRRATNLEENKHVNKNTIYNKSCIQNRHVKAEITVPPTQYNMAKWFFILVLLGVPTSKNAVVGSFGKRYVVYSFDFFLLSSTPLLKVVLLHRSTSGTCRQSNVSSESYKFYGSYTDRVFSTYVVDFVNIVCMWKSLLLNNPLPTTPSLPDPFLLLYKYNIYRSTKASLCCPSLRGFALKEVPIFLKLCLPAIVPINLFRLTNRYNFDERQKGR